MSKKVVIVGGGSAGWMTATTFIRTFPDWDITLVESPNIPISGVGESTLQNINQWLKLVGIEDKDFMKATDAVYKLSIKFENFHKQNDGGFHYPFSHPYLEGTKHGLNDWHYKKTYRPDTPNSDYADSYYSIMALVNENKFTKNGDRRLPLYQYGHHTAFHFDAVRFGQWLRKEICEPEGVNHIIGEVAKVHTNDNGVTGIEFDNGMVHRSDLYVDCTGFQSLLLDKSLKVPFESYRWMLPNNRAWATRIPYIDKQKQLEPYTSSTALGNGWVWNIPLWSRIGTGYVYSDDHTTPEDALEEFKTHLANKHKGLDLDSLQFKDLRMRIGLHDEVFKGNVVGIGLSAGFIEPLESNGLYTVHMFLVELMRTLLRSKDKIGSDIVSSYDRSAYNLSCKKMFNEFANFVSMHYALTQRTDTPYWRDCYNRNYSLDMLDETLSHHYGFKNFALDRMVAKQLYPTGGFPMIASGMGYNPVDMITERCDLDTFTENELENIINNLERNKKQWQEAVKTVPTMHDYLNTTIYKE